MRTIVALWHAFWQSFEIQRAQDALMRVSRVESMVNHAEVGVRFKLK